MASTGAILYLRPRVAATLAAKRLTGAVVFISPRMASGPWSTAGSITASRNLKSLKTWLPPANVPIGYVNGDPSKPVLIDSKTWYLFVDYLVNTVLGGPSAPTLADVTTAVTTASVQSASSAATVTAVSQQVQANAESLAATVQVAQNNSLSGASQIPPVQTYYETGNPGPEY